MTNFVEGFAKVSVGRIYLAIQALMQVFFKKFYCSGIIEHFAINIKFSIFIGSKLVLVIRLRTRPYLEYYIFKFYMELFYYTVAATKNITHPCKNSDTSQIVLIFWFFYQIYQNIVFCHMEKGYN